MPLPETPVDTGVPQSDAWCPVPAPDPWGSRSGEMVRTVFSGSRDPGL